MAIRITYNSNNIDVLIDQDALLPGRRQERNQNVSASGKIETINQYGIEEMAFAAILTETTERQCWAWWAWACQGKTWSFAKDSGAAANTTQDAAAAAGQKNIPLTSTAGFTAGDECLIQTAGRADFERVVIASVDAGVKVVAESNLIYTYAAGDSFRHHDYWPSVITLNDEFKPERHGDIYRHTFKFCEAL